MKVAVDLKTEYRLEGETILVSSSARPHGIEPSAVRPFYLMNFESYDCIKRIRDDPVA